MERWTLIFRVLGNINRLKIIKMLSGGESLSVGDIAEKLKISPNATSKHLIILQSVEALESRGTHGRVFYSLHKNIRSDFKRAIALFT